MSAPHVPPADGVTAQPDELQPETQPLDDGDPTGTPATGTEDDGRADRAAEITAAAQALFQTDAQAQDGEESEAAPGTQAPLDLPLITVLLDKDDLAEELPADDELPAQDATADLQNEDGDEDGQDEDSQDDDVEPAAVFPSFGLIFQAPDLSDLPRRRSRRATSGVTAPAPRADDDDLDDEPSTTTGSRGDALAEDEQGGPQDRRDQDGEPDGEQDDARGRRRRRGGKGRRTRGPAADGQDDGSGDAEQARTGQLDAEADDVRDGGDRRNDDRVSDDRGSNDDHGDDQGGDEQGGDGTESSSRRRRSRRGRRSGAAQGSGDSAEGQPEDTGERTDDDEQGDEESGGGGTRRRRRRSRSGTAERSAKDEVSSIKGSTRLEAKRQRRREGREAGRRRTIITEAEFLARRESVDRVMAVRGLEDRTQIAVLEDGVAVEHYVSRSTQTTMVGNVYLGRVQNVLPSMEAAFVDIGKGRNAVLYAGEVNWDAAGIEGNQPKRIENALKSGESVLVQVTKDPIGHKGARLTSQVSLPGRYLVYVPGNSMTGISRKLPDTERTRLKKILKEVVPDDAGVIVRTAAEGASEAELRADVERLTAVWERIEAKAKGTSGSAPTLLHGEPDMTVRVIRDVFNEDFSKLVVSGEEAWAEVKRYIDDVAPDLADRVERYTGTTDIFAAYRVAEAIAKAMDRKVWLPSGGSLVIDRTEAMTVVDVNTGKFTGSGGNLEETVTKNNIEAAEEIVRQLRLRDIGGIIVIDFIDMVLESNRDLVVRRLLECLGRDRTKHQVAEVTSLGLVQMTRKRVGSGLIEVFSETCAHCAGRGVIVQTEPVHRGGGSGAAEQEQGGGGSSKSGRGKGRGGSSSGGSNGGASNGANGNGSGANGHGSGGNGHGNGPKNVLPTPNPNGPTPAQIAAAAHAAALQAGATGEAANQTAELVVREVESEGQGAPVEAVAPEPERSAEPEQATVAPEAWSEPEPEVAPEPEVDPEPAPKPKRRRRGRAVAPAGPPTGDSPEDAG